MNARSGRYSTAVYELRRRVSGGWFGEHSRAEARLRTAGRARQFRQPLHDIALITGRGDPDPARMKEPTEVSLPDTQK